MSRPCILLILLSLIGLVQIMPVYADAWRDDFNGTTINRGRWTVSSPGCPGGICSFRNVRLQNGLLIISVPAWNKGGGEIHTNEAYGPGFMFSVNMKVSRVSFVRFAFFLFDPITQDEIDIIEIDAGILWFKAYSTIWHAAEKVWSSGSYSLGFDPSGGFHTYTLVYDRHGCVNFGVDGRVVSEGPMLCLDFAKMRLYISAYTYNANGPFAMAKATLWVDWAEITEFPGSIVQVA